MDERSSETLRGLRNLPPRRKPPRDRKLVARPAVLKLTTEEYHPMFGDRPQRCSARVDVD